MANTEIVKMWLDHDTHEKIDRMKSLMHAEHVAHVSISPVPLNTEQHLETLHRMHSIFGEQHHVIDQIIDNGSHVAVRGTLTAKHAGEFMGHQATDKSFTVTYMMFMEIVDGKVREEHLEMNPMSILMQLGLLNPPS